MHFHEVDFLQRIKIGTHRCCSHAGMARTSSCSATRIGIGLYPDQPPRYALPVAGTDKGPQ
jgi:hypothetical protein